MSVCIYLMMTDHRPIRSIEWEITTRCNYACSYCTQRTYLRLHSAHTSQTIVDAVVRLLDRSSEKYVVKLIGGEPFAHPRFLDIVRQLVGKGHSICTTTNLSVPERVIEEFVDATRNRLAYVTASFHPDQVRSAESFRKRAALFNERKDPATRFTVTAVGIEGHEQDLRSIAAWCDEHAIPFEVSPYKVRARYVEYQAGPFWDFVSSRMLSHAGEIRGKATFGTICHAGEMFGRITVEGDVVRCYNLQPSFYLGHVLDPSFRWFDGPRPCLAKRCSCTVPVERRMPQFGNTIGRRKAVTAYVRSLVSDVPHTSRFAGRWIARFVRHATRNPLDLLTGS